MALVAVRISHEHALVQCPRFCQMLSLGHHRGSPEGAGGSERLGIDAVRSGWLITCAPHALIQDGGSVPASITYSNCSMIRTNSVGWVVTRHC